MLQIEHFGGKTEASDAASLDRVLALRKQGVNEFWISGKERYPLLAIQVRDEVACLHFFPAEDHPGFLSSGDPNSEGEVVFYTNTPTEEIEVAAYAVVPVSQARDAAQEFLTRRELPSSLEWMEL